MALPNTAQPKIIASASQNSLSMQPTIALNHRRSPKLFLHSIPIPAPFQQQNPSNHPSSTQSARHLVVTAAKKGGAKGGKGGGGSKKPAGLQIPKKDPYLNTAVIMQNLLLIESYFRKTGRPLFDEEIEISDAAKALWEAPFPVLAHDTTVGDPVFNYANKAALDLFECTWDELMGVPSSQSAEPDSTEQSARSKILQQVTEKGYVDDYEGWRKSLKGTRFKIKNVCVFNIDAPSGETQGQGALIRCWEYEDGTEGGPLAAKSDTASTTEPPSEAEILDAERLVSEQGAIVRDLKETQGLSNSSDEVKAAVAELLERKKVLESMLERKNSAAS